MPITLYIYTYYTSKIHVISAHVMSCSSNNFLRSIYDTEIGEEKRLTEDYVKQFKKSCNNLFVGKLKSRYTVHRYTVDLDILCIIKEPTGNPVRSGILLIIDPVRFVFAIWLSNVQDPNDG